MLANFKIRETLIAKKPSEASDYLKYLKFLAIKGTTFQTKAILAFDHDFRATRTRENFSWGSNVDDLSAQYFDAAVALRPTSSQSSRTTTTDGRKSAASQSANDEFRFRWNLVPTVAQIHSLVGTSMLASIVPNNIKGSHALAPRGLVLKNNDHF